VTFGDLTFGEVAFGDLTFGEPTGHLETCLGLQMVLRLGL